MSGLSRQALCVECGCELDTQVAFECPLLQVACANCGRWHEVQVLREDGETFYAVFRLNARHFRRSMGEILRKAASVKATRQE